MYLKIKMGWLLNLRAFMCIITISLFYLWLKEYLRVKTEIEGESYIKSMLLIKKIFHDNRMLKSRVGPKVKTKAPNMKYILLWTSAKDVPFEYLEEGRRRFIKNRCMHTNCYVTSDRYFLEDYTQFDVILFAGPEVVISDVELPARRSELQKYVFASIESSHSYAMCTDKYDGFFNWTWTFRLDSDTRWGYIIIRNTRNKIIGPNKSMHWIKLEDMKPVSGNFKNSLMTKTKAAAWFVSNCKSDNGREYFVKNLEIELDAYHLSIDKYGKCGMLSCPKEEEERCGEIIKSTYYFYLAFENSNSEDYVTEKLLLGLKNNAIPIVYGGANYTRFMPDGIYLNARELGPKKLADKMNELIKDPKKYAEYFKWKNHYKYQKKSDSIETDDYCNMCKLLNNKRKIRKKSVYKNFKKWWDSPNFC